MEASGPIKSAGVTFPWRCLFRVDCSPTVLRTFVPPLYFLPATPSHPTSMDYSAISSDADHPPGSSPWGSPRADRTTFAAASNNDVPSSPLPPQEQAPPDAGHQRESPDLSERLQSAQLGDPDYAVEQPPYGSQSGEQQRSQLPARYQTAARQHPKQPTPVYKIQAKITALERTGKKDPVLRFDVHVSKAVLLG